MAFSEKLRITSMLKPGVNDPEGNAIKNALHQLGFEGVDDVKTGHFLEIDSSTEINPEAISELMSPRSRDFPVLGSKVLKSYTLENLPQIETP